MPSTSGLATDDSPLSGRVHIIGAGPVGLLLTALLQPNEGVSVHLYEKRPEYTRTRMVQLAPYLVADSIESYCADSIDGESVSAIFQPRELAEGLAFRQSIPPDLLALLPSAPTSCSPTRPRGSSGSRAPRSPTSSAASSTTAHRLDQPALRRTGGGPERVAGRVKGRHP